MEKGLHAWEIGELNNVIQDIVEYIDVKGASRPSNRGLRMFLKIL